MNIEFKAGMPSKPGWYLVKLVNGHVYGDKPYDVDFCKEHKNGGLEWCKFYKHNISSWVGITDLVDSPEQSPDNSGNSLLVSGLSNHEGHSTLDESELKALHDVRLLAENLLDRFDS